jgi:hypothetical protein
LAGGDVFEGMSNVRRFLPVFLLSTAMALLAGACIGDSGSTGSGGASYPTKVVEAPIDGVDIQVRETAPPQYVAVITSGLPNGCARFEAAEIVSRTDAEVVIRVTNRVPDSDQVVCTMIYGTHESTVDLGTDFVSGREYTVVVNGERRTFTAQ